MSKSDRGSSGSNSSKGSKRKGYGATRHKVSCNREFRKEIKRILYTISYMISYTTSYTYTSKSYTTSYATSYTILYTIWYATSYVELRYRMLSYDIVCWPTISQGSVKPRGDMHSTWFETKKWNKTAYNAHITVCLQWEIHETHIPLFGFEPSTSHSRSAILPLSQRARHVAVPMCKKLSIYTTNFSMHAMLCIMRDNST